MDHTHIYIMQILFVGGITYARYVFYVLSIRAVQAVCALAYDVVRNNKALDARLLENVNKNHLMMCLASIGYLLLEDQYIIDRHFGLMMMAALIVKYPEIVDKKNKCKSTVTYGVGMACSYFEGYLVHVLPSDGARFFGFEENIRAYESSQGVVFPVKKLFVVVTKSLYSPPALKDFNKSDREDIARLEVCSSLSEIEKDVAGVKNRSYKNTACKIYRPRARPVCLSVEGGTPMHTLYRVLKNRDLGDVLVGLNREEILADFLTTVRKFIAKSPECRDKCEIIFYDDTNKDLNLADILLDRIRELEPNFEEIIAARR